MVTKALQLADALEYCRAYEAANEVRKLHSEREELIYALRGLVKYERGHDYHRDRVGALYAADVALNKALGDAEWPM